MNKERKGGKAEEGKGKGKGVSFKWLFENRAVALPIFGMVLNGQAPDSPLWGRGTFWHTQDMKPGNWN